MRNCFSNKQLRDMLIHNIGLSMGLASCLKLRLYKRQADFQKLGPAATPGAVTVCWQLAKESKNLVRIIYGSLAIYRIRNNGAALTPH